MDGKSLRITLSKTPITPPNHLLETKVAVPPQLNVASQLLQTQASLNKIPRTVYVSGLNVLLKEQHLIQFFTVCGQVSACRICGDTQHPTRFAFIEFTTPEAAVMALGLTGITLGSSPIKVVPSKTAIQASPYIPPSRMMTMDPSYQDKVSRTIYVGSVDTNVTEQDLLNFFQQCGKVAKLCLAGDTVHAARFAFVEFETKECAIRSLSLNGTVLGDRPIRVNASKTPVHAPPKKVISSDQPVRIESASRYRSNKRRRSPHRRSRSPSYSSSCSSWSSSSSGSYSSSSSRSPSPKRRRTSSTHSGKRSSYSRSRRNYDHRSSSRGSRSRDERRGSGRGSSDRYRTRSRQRDWSPPRRRSGRSSYPHHHRRYRQTATEEEKLTQELVQFRDELLSAMGPETSRTIFSRGDMAKLARELPRTTQDLEQLHFDSATIRAFGDQFLAKISQLQSANAH
eukprot:TRINITY_DN2915_c0_g1_i1.p1 TRINITY_DN2915_c0_g1~~TRINITY_DN2915_c0_g1_i1.p1  ORF type:complete len:454 (-),score=39.85 TRINITY_DN2915_c0_g1_i1:28-1389(-)